MTIGIVGSGNLGSAMGKRLAMAGHELCFSYSRDLEKMEALAQSIGANARTGSPEEAARFGEIVLLAVPWAQVEDAIAQMGDAINGKLLWTTVNALKPDMSGMAIGTSTSAAEEIARLAPGATVVEAIACNADILTSPSLDFGTDHPGTFVCGDDPEARQIVAGLMRDIGLVPTDAGPLTTARLIEPTGFLIAYLAYGLGMGGDRVAMKVLTR
ncbi:MAG: NAD(P)-binding domain-containing protein [Armatimonadaceae bacterium]